MSELEKYKIDLFDSLEVKVHENILDQNDFEYLKYFIAKSETIDEAQFINQLGTLAKPTGLFYSIKNPKKTDKINILSKKVELTFNNGDIRHKLIIGENYDALRNLLISYRNKIDLIYIDPPYGKDNMGNYAKTNYNNSLTRDHLLSELHNRLLLSRQLLNEDGYIFCSIDDKNQAHIKLLFDNIFGENNFLGTILRKTRTNPKTEEHFSKNYDYLLIYKNSKSSILKGKEIENNSSIYKTNDYKFKDNFFVERGKFYIKQPIDKKDYQAGLDFIYEINGKKFYAGGSEEEYERRQKKAKNDDYRWTWNKETIDWGFKNNLLEIKGNRIYKKQYEKVKINGKTKTIENKEKEYLFFNGFTFTSNNFTNEVGTKELEKIFGTKKFEFPKPVSLIKEILSYFDDDITILDFYAGSGTTGQAVLEMNSESDSERKFILCTNNEINENFHPNGIVTDVTYPRIIHSLKAIEDNSLDVYEIVSFDAKNHSLIDAIDPKNYEIDKSLTLKEKVDWVLNNFGTLALNIEEE